jgi:acyl carrier protein
VIPKIGSKGHLMSKGGRITREQLRAALRLQPDANTALSFEELGIDSWDFIEFRAILETQFGMVFLDEEWVLLNCPDDILRNSRESGQ